MDCRSCYNLMYGGPEIPLLWLMRMDGLSIKSFLQSATFSAFYRILSVAQAAGVFHFLEVATRDHVARPSDAHGVVAHVVGHRADATDLRGVHSGDQVVGSVAWIDLGVGRSDFRIVDPIVFTFAQVVQGKDVTRVLRRGVGVGDPDLDFRDVDA